MASLSTFQTPAGRGSLGVVPRLVSLCKVNLGLATNYMSCTRGFRCTLDMQQRRARCLPRESAVYTPSISTQEHTQHTCKPHDHNTLNFKQLKHLPVRIWASLATAVPHFWDCFPHTSYRCKHGKTGRAEQVKALPGHAVTKGNTMSEIEDSRSEPMSWQLLLSCSLLVAAVCEGNDTTNLCHRHVSSFRVPNRNAICFKTVLRGPIELSENFVIRTMVRRNSETSAAH